MSENLTHWKSCFDNKYLGAYALEPGKDMVLTIKSAKEEKVIGNAGKEEKRPVLYFYEAVKPMVVNSINGNTLRQLFKSPFLEKWKDQKIQIYVEYGIKAFGSISDGLRVRPFLPKSETYTCADCGQEITPAANMTAQQVAEHTHKTYGRTLCAACGAKAKQAAQAAKQEGDVLS